MIHTFDIWELSVFGFLFFVFCFLFFVFCFEGEEERKENLIGHDGGLIIISHRLHF